MILTMTRGFIAQRLAVTCVPKTIDKTSVLVALLLATGVTAYSFLIGNSDIENSLKISSSIAI